MLAIQAGKPFGCRIGVDMNNIWEEGTGVIVKMPSLYTNRATAVSPGNSQPIFAWALYDPGPLSSQYSVP